MNRPAVRGSAFSLLALIAVPALLRAQVPASQREAWEEFEARRGSGWQAAWDERTGLLREAVGPGAPLFAPGWLASEQGVALGNAVVEENRALLGVGPEDLAPTIAAPARTIFYLVYGQRYRGLEVVGGRVDLRFHMPTGRLVLLGSEAIPGIDLDPRPRIPADRAEGFARSLFPFVAGRDEVEPPRLVVFPVGGVEPRLAWEVGLRIDEPLTHPLLYLDAATLETLDVRERVQTLDYTGSVSGNGTSGTLPDTPSNPPGMKPLKGVSVTVPGVGSAVTDGLGNFTVPSGSMTPQSVTVNLSGPHFNVNNYGGTSSAQPDTTITLTVTPGVPANFVFNSTPAQYGTAEVNGAFQTQFIHDWIQSIAPVTGINFAIPVNVNRNSSCNAYFSSSGGGNINFYWQSTSCVNTAYSTVIHHEYGHFLDYVLAGIANGGLSEGIGDQLASYATGQPIVGEDFFLNGNDIRTADNNRAWPAMECSNEVHCLGEIWAGFCWHARQNLASSLGAAAGTAHAEDLVMNSYLANANSIRNAVLEVYVQDDDDGNLANGTPNMSALGQSAQRHGYFEDLFAPITFAHAPVSHTTVTTAPYPVSVTATPKVGSIAGATLYVSVNGGAFVPSALANAGGNVWTGSIAAASAPATVKYYFQASNDQAYTRRFPVPTDDAFVFNVGVRGSVFFDDMEAGVGGWTTAAISGTNDWQWGSIPSPALSSFDPPSAFSGTRLFGTDLTTNGLYPNSTTSELRSPVLNLSGKTGTRLRFERWVTMRPNDTARARVNGVDVWSSSTSGGLGDQHWITMDIPIGALADNNPSVQIVFRLESNSSTSSNSIAGGWNLDDVEVYTVNGLPPCGPPTVFGVGSLGAGGIVPTLAATSPAPQIGNALFGLEVASGVGGAPGLLVLAASETSIPYGGGTIYVVPGVAIPFALGGAAGSPGAGSATVSVPIPYDPFLVGAQVSCQGGVLDTAAGANVALTALLRITICL